MLGTALVLLAKITGFRRDDNGATTVDFVVLTAACIGVAIAITVTLGVITADHADRVADEYTNVGVKTY